MITWDVFLLRYYAAAALAGGSTLWLLWRATRNVKSIWVRSLPRAIFTAVVFTPTIIPIPEIGGAVPMPAIWICFYGIFGRDGKVIDLALGGAAILIATVALWLIFAAAARKRLRSIIVTEQRNEA